MRQPLRGRAPRAAAAGCWATAVGLGVLLLVPTAGAAALWHRGSISTAWSEATPGLWNDPTRWTAGVPGAGDTALFGGSPSTTPFEVTLEGPVTIGPLVVASQRPTIDLADSLLTVVGVARVAGSDADAPEATIEGGSLAVQGPLAVGLVETAEPAIGSLTIRDATVKASSIVVGTTASSTGLLTMGPNVTSGGSVYVASTATLGGAGNGTLQAVGSGTVLPFNTLQLGDVAGGSGGIGRVEVSDGATLRFFKAIFGQPSTTARSTLAVRGAGSLLAMNQPTPQNAIQGPKTIEIADGGIFGGVNLSLGSNDVLRYEIGPNGPGLLANVGGLTLGGTLEVTFAPGYLPPSGAVFPLATTYFLFGGFQSISTPTVNGQPLQLLTFGTSVVLVTPSFNTEVVVAPGSLDIPIGVYTLLQPQTALPDGTRYLFNAQVTWQSDDPSIATVTPAGVVVGVQPGTTTIRMISGKVEVEVPTTVRFGPPSAPAAPDLVCVSVDSEGLPAGQSGDPANQEWFLHRFAFGGDGRLIAFQSDAHLVDEDRDDARDVYLRDLVAGTTTSISAIGPGGVVPGLADLPAMSDDGRFVSYRATGVAPDGPHIVVHDRLTGESEVITAATLTNAPGISADCRSSALSADGRYVAWIGKSGSLTLPPGDSALSAFRMDRLTGEVVRAAVTFDGLDASVARSVIAISSDGQRVAFVSSSKILPDSPSSVGQVYVRDLSTGEVFAASKAPEPGPVSVWADTTPVSVALDRSGRIVSFLAEAPSLAPSLDSPVVAHFIANQREGTLRLAVESPEGVSSGSSDAVAAAISRSGRFAATLANPLYATPYITENVVAIRRDLVSGAIELCSINAAGLFNSWVLHGVALSGDGSRLAFGTKASNVVPGDSPGTTDIFAVRLWAPLTGDLNEDGAVGAEDLAELLGLWGTDDPTGDLNGDGQVSAGDLAILLGAWTPARP